VGQSRPEEDEGVGRRGPVMEVSTAHWQVVTKRQGLAARNRWWKNPIE